MKVLLLGSGGREHALALKIRESASCTALFIAPGNPGTAQCGINVSLDFNDRSQLHSFLDREGIDLIVAGPEQPLVDGLADDLRAMGALDHRVFFGPAASGARLEGSKRFAKAFMMRHQIPTAAYASFNRSEAQEAADYLKKMRAPYVIKADGLAAGKGVIITSSLSEAQEVLKELFDGSLGDAGQTVVLEEFLDGVEFSVFVMTNGEALIWLPEAKDYKRIGEGDTGPNTGGMGSLSPVPFVNQELMQKVDVRIVQPTLKGLQEEGIPYLGFIFFGLILVNGEPYVIEYNARMGDPETQSVMPRVQGDFVEAMWNLGKGLPCQALPIDSMASASVVLVAEGYPGAYEKGKEIEVAALNGVHLLHAGTAEKDGKLITNGGRVMAINAKAHSVNDCLRMIYSQTDQVDFEGKRFRRDIGKDVGAL
jgi:phosphoribosylamine--glycine ligase